MCPNIFRLSRCVLSAMILHLICCSFSMGEEAAKAVSNEVGVASSSAQRETKAVTPSPSGSSEQSATKTKSADLKKHFLEQVSALCSTIEKTVPVKKQERQKELKKKLLDQISVLYSQMAISTNAQNMAAWKAFLMTEEVVSTLKAPKFDQKVLDKSLEAFQSKEDGLDNPMFVPVRGTLESLVEINRHSNIDSKSFEEDQKYVAKLCRELPTSVSKLAEKYDAKLAEQITLALEDIKYYRPESNDMRQLINIISAYFTVPNFMFSTSSNLLVTGVVRKISEDVNITDTIRGAYVTGQGHVDGDLLVKLVPNERMAQIMLYLNTRIGTNTVATQEGTYVYSTSSGTVQAQKAVFVNKEFLTGQATATGAMTSQITGVNSGRRNLGQNIAEQRVMEEKPYSEMESTRKMEYRIASRLDEDVDAQIKSVNASLRERFISKLEKQKYYPRAIVSRTSADRLYWSALVANDIQFGLPAPCRGMKDNAMKDDASVLLHESFPNNASFFAFAGRRVSDQQVAQNVSQLFSDKLAPNAANDKKKPAANDKNQKNTKAKPDDDKAKKNKTETTAKSEKISDDTPLWLSFANDLPILTTFDKNQVRIALRIDQFEKDDRTYPGLDVDIVYEIVKKGKTFVFHRKVLDVFPAGLKRNQVIPARYQAIRSLVLKRLEDQLEKDVTIQNIATADFGKPSSKGSIIRNGLLIPHAVTAQQGWLQLDYKFSEKSKP